MMEESKSMYGYLPQGWEEAAKTEGALVRSRRIKTAEDLLMMILIYLISAGSYQNTSTLMAMSAGIQINKEAVRKRIMNSWRWLRWMGQELAKTHRYIIEPPQWLRGRRVKLCDGSDGSLRGSKGSDYRMHYAFDLFGYTCSHVEVTSAREGEKLSRFPAQEGDIFIADRAYGTIKGMEYMREAKAGFILRLKTNAFTIYDKQGERLNFIRCLRALKEQDVLSMECFYKNMKGVLVPVRVAVFRKDEEAAARTVRKLSRTAARKRLGVVSGQAQEMASYIVLATNLPESTERVLELYRARWQVECVFHRLKGLLDLGELPGSNEDAVKAWFYGKLLVAALAETMQNSVSFSP